MRRLRKPGKTPKIRTFEGVTVKDYFVPTHDGSPGQRVRLYTPAGSSGSIPALLWIHGGGMVIGNPEQDVVNCVATVRELGIAVAATAYRLAPEHPFPAPPDDCYAALSWLHANAESLGIRPDKIAVGGASAGGGLAAAIALMAHDRQENPLAFQLLVYPMLDDRTVQRDDIDVSKLKVWNTKSNAFAWSSYRGSASGEVVDPYFAPARRQDLTGLAPAWLGVGTYDLFHDEGIEYARRLNEVGVLCDSMIVPGAYHAFDVVSRKAPVVLKFRQSYLDALRRHLLDD